MRIAKISEVKASEIVDSEELELSLVPEGYSDDMEMFQNEKAFKQFIIRLKYYTRKSYEYSELMKFLKDEHGMNFCGVHPNVKRSDGFQIHIHHTPFTMEDIVYIVVRKRQEEQESMKMSDIAEEVMYLHYLGLVGLYPLCETCHEYVHSEANDLFIPLDKVFGNPEAFVDIYSKYLKETPLMTKFDNIRVLNKGYTLLEQTVPLALRKKYIYVTVKDKKGDDQLMISNSKLYDLISSDKLMDLIKSCDKKFE